MNERNSVLIVGSGGREHALGFKLRQSPAVGELYFAPGNAGTSGIGENIPIRGEDVDALIAWADQNHPDLTVVGPEAPLSEGIVDAFEERGLAIFGPNKAASQLEVSKVWATDFMERHAIPHPRSRVFTESSAALNFVQTNSWDGVVIKADGLAAGKGVIVADSKEEAEAAVRSMMVEGAFAGAGRTVVIQEKLTGPEVSVLAFCDGNVPVPLIPAQDHKRIFDGDRGPNTGGIGAYAPVPLVDGRLFDEIHRTILQPTVDGMREEGHPFKGILFAGLMLTSKGPKVLEYNVRFGDPETQPIMMLLESDLAPILASCIGGTLDQSLVRFRKGSAACVVIASKGYPESSEKGVIIEGLHASYDPNLMVFHAGTLQTDQGAVTHGGRVLGVTAYGRTIGEALSRAYGAIGSDGVHFEGMQYRRDIGGQAI